MIKPKKLKKGDKVAIVSLSSGILGEDFCSHQVKLGVKRLEELNLKPVFMDNSLKGLSFIKNNPKLRAKDLKDTFSDDSIKAIICAIGGDDTYKTIPYLMEDKEFIKNVKENPKIFIGFSDSTNNHIMLNNLGLVTYYGLNFLSDLAELEINMLEYTKDNYLRFFDNPTEYNFTSSNNWYLNRKSYGVDQINSSLTAIKEEIGYEYINGTGVVNGIFWGGCLDSIYDIYSNNRYSDQYDIYKKYNLLPADDKVNNIILFLETSEECPKPEEFRKMLDVLITKNIFENVKAILFGKPYDGIYYDEYKDIIKEYSFQYNLPVVLNINFGHSIPRMVIPYGVKGAINFDNKSIKVSEKMFDY